MGEVIVITSGKGGVGKTTVTANLGAALSKLGRRVVVIDSDMGLRNLDVAMGLENRIVYDALDVLEGICTVQTAAIQDERYENLYLIPAPQTRDNEAVNHIQLRKLCKSLAKEYDYVLLDSPAGIERGFFNAVKSADSAIVVTEPFTAAVRDADRTVGLLEKAGIPSIRLIINKIRLDLVKDGVMLNADDILDILSVRLLGIIPYDEQILYAAKEGNPVVEEEHSMAAAAYGNIAARLTGQEIPIMEMEQRQTLRERMKNIFKRQQKK